MLEETDSGQDRRRRQCSGMLNYEVSPIAPTQGELNGVSNTQGRHYTGC